MTTIAENQYHAELAQATRQGWRIESTSPTMTTLVKGHRVNHILHLLLTVLTLGFWVFIWLPLTLLGGEKRRTILKPVEDFA